MMGTLRHSTGRWRLWLAGAVCVCVLGKSAAGAEEAPKQWEQLFFPFPIVGAPPQLEQQVQLFENYFRGGRGSGNGVAAELGYIVTAHLGLVLTVPYQIGVHEQPTGFGDLSLLVQYLAAGSLRLDNMLSVGLQSTFPTAQHDLGGSDYFVGPFLFAGQRLWHHLILEANFTALVPLVHGDSARQLAAAGLVSVLLSPVRFDYPVYAQVEVNSTTFLAGTAALPPDAAHSPAQTVFVAPEIFLGPFASPLSEGTRLAAGIFFNLTGDSVHDHSFMLTAAFDIPNRFGY